ncbi:taste receptor type 2 member 40-like [Takifugu flavidus]|uniref:Taste receptor type 2 n=1 Tax=Takifugu flavidus TaxID=433684 RepID=A0A5C6N243_9TELE|nr:taste receptor type 2 member 40-like [Takifugu flavidus]TWW60818.1 hypothetical protein D4764_05G0009080 [Takifugu flavidus]
MLESDDLKLCGIALFLVLGVLANLFNLGAMLGQQQGRTVAVIICFISLGNILLQTSTCVLVASIRAGVLCRPHLPFFFSGVLYVWFISSSVSIWSVAWLNVFYCVKVCRFSWIICRTLEENISSILNITMVIMFLTSCVMFTPFFGLHFQDQHVNATEMGACVIRKPLLPAWVDINTYVITFICFLTLMPSTIMLPTSLGLVVYLCRRTAKTRRSSSAESYLLVCRLTVALVWVYLTTLLIISLYYFHALFASGLSADVLFSGLSFYCVACAALLSCSNKHLRGKLRVLLCRGKRTNTMVINAEGK